MTWADRWRDDAGSDHQANIISHARLVTMGDPNIANELEMLGKKKNLIELNRKCHASGVNGSMTCCVKGSVELIKSRIQT
jgi:hypothetical protein